MATTPAGSLRGTRVGSAISGPLLRSLSPPALVLGAVGAGAALIALLGLTTNPFAFGAVLGRAIALGPAWNGLVVVAACACA